MTLSSAEISAPEGVTFYTGDCLEILSEIPDTSIDSIVTDPPAAISFMGKEWDRNKGGRRQWVSWLTEVMSQAYRVLKPGGHALVWAIPRTSHWTATALEDAGFEIRDCVIHIFAQGFPKSHNVSKAIDKAAGAEREVVGSKLGRPGYSLAVNAPGGRHAYGEWTDAESECAITAPATDDAKRWDGWGTALKPASEHWWLVRKPLSGTVATNVVEHGTGGLNIDGCRVEIGEKVRVTRNTALDVMNDAGWQPKSQVFESHSLGRWPTNVVFTHSPDCEDSCVPGCPVGELDQQSGILTSGLYEPHHKRHVPRFGHGGTYGEDKGRNRETPTYGDSGGASRFFPLFRYQAKAPSKERPKLPDGTAWPTVKPVALTRWLVRLVTPPGGTVLDPFGGTGTTAQACLEEGFKCVLIERDETAIALAKIRLGID